MATWPLPHDWPMSWPDICTRLFLISWRLMRDCQAWRGMAALASIVHTWDHKSANCDPEQPSSGPAGPERTMTRQAYMQVPCFSCFICQTAKLGWRFTDFPLVGKATSPGVRPQEPGTEQKVQVPPRPNDLQVPVSEHILCRYYRGPDHHHWHLHQPHFLGTLQQVSNSLSQRISTNHPCVRNVTRC